MWFKCVGERPFLQKGASKTKEAIMITMQELWTYVQDPPSKEAFLAARQSLL
jgi:hypothetical protein